MIEPVVLQPLGPVVRQGVPQWLVPLFLFITRLGNVALLLVLFVVDYWFFDHERGAHAIAILVAGMAVITGLKYFFAVPRPPASVTVIPIDGFSFPSGHAMGATIAYGTLAYDLDVGPRRLRYGLAGALIALIALSRVVLGVHFVRDVVAGVVFGVAFLAVAFSLTGHDPRKGFGLAVLLGAVAFVVSGASQDGVILLGSAVGATGTWEWFDDVPSVDVREAKLLLAGVLLPVLAAIGYFSFYGGFPPPVEFALSALLMAAIIAAPVIEDPVERLRTTGQPQRR